ncbi:Co2+/Mg2+ efflux protein ApaG [Thalassotalea sp. SU-HH00458]|uniref:Co2+/Mg2+ efflux protein ApaG n=1 Tax=Thalassotalea sp. SU-HH00458 TaxID=3127657 RepID=UPI003106165A
MTDFLSSLIEQNPVPSENSNVKVSIETNYIPEHSNELEKRYVFSYTITITNNTEESVKLLTRYWLITDANKDTSTVAGEGVIGKQPVIPPSKSFVYTSGCVLKTPVGTMQGHYQMLTEHNKNIQVEIPVFRLALPNILN